MGEVIEFAAARRRRLDRLERPVHRDAVDAWFHLWTIPAQVYLAWLRDLHRHLRP